MKVKALVALKSKLFKPCKKLLSIFRFKLKRPIFIRAFRFRARHVKLRATPAKDRAAGVLSVFHSLKRSRKMDRVRELRSFSDAVSERMLYSSPLTPGSVRGSKTSKREPTRHEEVEDACRSFENYLIEMIVEEGKVKDLMDVEDLLYCWKNLKCPVFIDLVCRFYAELCKDLFSTDEDDDGGV